MSRESSHPISYEQKGGHQCSMKLNEVDLGKNEWVMQQQSLKARIKNQREYISDDLHLLYLNCSNSNKYTALILRHGLPSI